MMTFKWFVTYVSDQKRKVNNWSIESTPIGVEVESLFTQKFLDKGIYLLEFLHEGGLCKYFSILFAAGENFNFKPSDKI